MPRAVVARRGRPAVCLLDQMQTVAILFDDSESAVSRAVIDANHIEILEGLRDDAIDGASDRRRRIVGRNNYSTTRHCWLCSLAKTDRGSMATGYMAWSGG